MIYLLKKRAPNKVKGFLPILWAKMLKKSTLKERYLVREYTQIVYRCIINCLYQLCYKYYFAEGTRRNVGKYLKKKSRDSHGAVIFRMSIIPIEITTLPLKKKKNVNVPHVFASMCYNTLRRVLSDYSFFSFVSRK